MANWKKVLVSGSAIEVLNITASGVPAKPTGLSVDFLAIDSEGRLVKTGSAGGGGGGIFIDQSTFYDTSNSIKITGSTLQAAPKGGQGDDFTSTSSYQSSYASNNYAFLVSQSAYFDNHNVGHPNSLAWGSNLDGSIFNSYNASTDVSEILRTLVGLISSSNGDLVASPLPEPVIFTGTDVLPDTDGAPTTILDTSLNTNARIPQNYSEATVQYLEHKGFNDGAGDKVFQNVASTVYTSISTNRDFGVVLRSDPGDGGTYFDAGSTGTEFTVFAVATQSFSDTNTDTTPDENSTFTTSSFYKYTQTGAGTSNGITVEQISTSNPTVIPPQFQKALFTGVPLQTDLETKASTTFTNISSSGYYAYHGVKAGIATGSTSISDVIGGSLTTSTNTSNALSTYFLTPLQDSDISDNSVTTTEGTVTHATATSRSLSGAPYLNNSTYTVVDYTASGLFDPLFYGNVATIASMSIGSTTLQIKPTSGDDVRARANGGTIDYGNIFDGNTERTNGTVPGKDDTVRFNTTYTFGRSTGRDSYESNEDGDGTPSDTSFTVDLSTRTWKGSTSNSETQTVNYHTAGAFGQPSASGSLSYFISNDGEDTAPGSQASSTSTEYFGGEGYRLPIEATGDLTGSNAWDSGSRLTLGDGGDLQVKPGYLVNPESSKGYWYPATGFDASHYKWYVREFDTGFAGSNASTLTLDFDPNNDNDFVAIGTTTDNKIAIGVIFEYQIETNSGTGDGSDAFSGARTRIFDLYNGYGEVNDLNEANVVPSNQKNPFSDNVDLRAQWGGGSEVTGTVTMTLANNVGQKITSTYSKVYLAIRYTGSPTNSLEKISVSAS